jgi:steroid 5-alpha reductase family enzyme
MERHQLNIHQSLVPHGSWFSLEHGLTSLTCHPHFLFVSAQFLSNPAVTFGTAIAAFYLPVIIMTVLYIHISLASRSRVSKHKPDKKDKKGIK